ncbi:MAG: aldo/keto reductase [Lactobacillus sp.]|jgi:diketogulonate reductase-like aldo/keto reductase|nr:aldo/keto reductase [Lactobacillus sp.]MCH3906389.1 aldo/keto reductase [Lactobacillus sp.]MCH3990036.1 aldo/keto reductase [Lactobacillus sp.]MCH4069250.1 aldo/keto reductase [Lactobacillus sp.]MCI1303552.1 aldo/keto reductase [Lactobacillus sp.]
MTNIPYVKLNDGHKMPQLGFGVFQIPDHDQAVKTVEMALANGYRLIDTAEAYNNQQAVGEGIKNSGVARDEIFLTTKLWVSNFTYEKAKAAIDNDLKELGTDYIDLLLLHQAYGDVYGAWRAMEEAQKAGKIKSIGVSNFWPDQLVNLQLGNNVKPAVNQIEINPWFQREPEVKWNQSDDVTVEAWAPFAEGKDGIFTNPVLKEIGEKYGKSTGQVILRWLLQRGIVVIPKSVHDARQKENIDVFDFELSADDMKKIAALDKNKSQFFDHHDPMTIEQIFGSSLAQLKD